MNIQKMKNGKYRVREMRDGKTYSLTVDHKPTTREAVHLIDEIVFNNNKPIKNKTVLECCEEYIQIKENVLSPSTINGHLSKLKQLKKLQPQYMLMDLSQFTNINFQKFINLLTPFYSPKTIKEFYSIIKVSIQTFIDINFKITLPQKIKKEPYIPNDNDIKILLENAKDTIYEVPIKLALNGLRRSEIVALTLDDIGDGTINVNKAKVRDRYGCYVLKTTKTTNSTRVVKVSKNLTNLIKKKKKVLECKIDSVKDFLDRTQKKYNLPHFSLHKLRHYYASMMMTQGVPAKYIMEQGGWASKNVMENIYTHTFKDKTFADKGIKYLEKLEDKT